MWAVQNLSLVLIELGAAITGLALLAHVASRLGFSPIPLYLVGGLAFGNGGLLPLNLSQHFIHIGGEIGVLLVLFLLGLEYTPHRLAADVREGYRGGIADFVLNFPPGFLAGLLMKWPPMAAVLLGGITYISSSGIVVKVLTDLRRMDAAETRTIISILVMEDVAMAAYLPIVAVLLRGGTAATIAQSVLIALAFAGLALFVAFRYGPRLSHLIANKSDEAVLLTALGIVLLVAGGAERFGVSAAVGAFLAGLTVSEPIAAQSHRVLAPLRDFFAAIFFFFFGLQIDPGTLPAALPAAIALGVITAGTKIATGYWSARDSAEDLRGRIRAGIALTARGEFSIVIAGLGAGIEPRLGPLAAAYVLFLAVLGPLAVRLVR